MTRREELYPVIKRMREQDGLMWREIGAALGVSSKTAHDYYSDPDGSKAWARKHRTACYVCGAVTNSGTPSKSDGTRCRSCSDAEAAEAGRVWMIRRIRDWYYRFGQPPTAPDWNRAEYCRLLHPAAADRQHAAAAEQWPSTNGVVNAFGSWNAGVEAAGFTPVRSGGGRRWAA